ncbi:MAG: cytochrome P450 [Chloroflexi bacterium]|nr:cytochrome P450 [Chloroflexota bacterium]
MSEQTYPIPPLAQGLPLVGSILALANDAQDFFYSQYRKLGNVFRVRAFNQEFKVLAGPEINILMATQMDAFTAWDIWKPVIGDFGGRKTMTMLEGPEHARLRRLMRQSFSRETLITNIPQVLDLTTSFLKSHQLGERVQAVYFMQHLTANILGALSNERLPGEYFDDIVTWWNALINVHLVHLKPASSLQTPAYLRARSRAKEFATLVFMQRKANRPAGDEDNFLDNLADAVEHDPEFMNQDEALFLTLAGYFAGLDTVANVSAFMLYELLSHPEILAAARAEADLAFADGLPSAESFRKMPTLHAAAQETLRLYPVAGALGRIAARDFEFGGYTLRKGEQFIVATAAPHFSTKFYAEPYSFDIERYHEPRNEHKQRGVYAPFGAGSHTCLGAGLAEVQIMLAVAAMLHYADFSMDPPNYKLKKVYTPSLTPKDFVIKFSAWRH